LGNKRERTIFTRLIKKLFDRIYPFTFIFFLFTQISFAQVNSYPFEFFTAHIEGTKLSIITPEQNLIYEKDFVHPAVYTSDLDEDGINELLIVDSILSDNRINFNLFIYNTLDSFYLADSISSGSYLPYETVSEEVSGIIIVSGNPLFDLLNEGVEEYFIPVNCWKYEDAALILMNADIYDIFISENEFLIDYIDDIYLEYGEECSTSLKLKSAIASAYANYINAGEESVASQFLKNYYLCEDFEEFRNKISEMLNTSFE
jgi:hypothetical protein